jgi:hypothetical protein
LAEEAVVEVVRVVMTRQAEVVAVVDSLWVGLLLHQR